VSETLKELRRLSDDELIKRHDQNAERTVVGTAHYLNELARRDMDRHTRTMIRYTWWIAVMTLIVAVSAIITTVAALLE
jgi:signal transduction histidine kinase